MYNLVVIGADTAGLISAIGCVALGGKVALVERNLMGGDCLNVGSVPSRSLLRSRAAMEKDGAEKYGLTGKHPLVHGGWLSGFGFSLAF
ncbi:MAG: FAD-dependent oxidoreductase [Acidobacteriota bacterium]